MGRQNKQIPLKIKRNRKNPVLFYNIGPVKTVLDCYQKAYRVLTVLCILSITQRPSSILNEKKFLLNNIIAVINGITEIYSLFCNKGLYIWKNRNYSGENYQIALFFRNYYLLIVVQFC